MAIMYLLLSYFSELYWWMYRKSVHITKKHKQICVRRFIKETKMDTWNEFLFLLTFVFDYLVIDCSCFIVNYIVVQFGFSL